MDCSICKLKGIAKGTLLCPRCGSLVERDEIIHSEDQKRVQAEEISILKGKVVELAARKDRLIEKTQSQKMLIYFLLFCLIGLLVYQMLQKPKLSPEAVRYEKLQEMMSSYQKEMMRLKDEISELKKLGLVEPPQPPPVEEWHTYTVKEGDSLSKIARDIYGDPGRYQEIAQINNLNSPYVLRRGDRIKLKRNK